MDITIWYSIVNSRHRHHTIPTVKFEALFTEDFYKPMKKGKSEAHYVFVGRAATVVVVILGLLWMPVMMSMGNLYSYLQDIQSLIAPAMVAVFTLGIFSKKITPKAGEWGLIGATWWRNRLAKVCSVSQPTNLPTS